MTFSKALKLLKKGYKVSRAGWNGEYMWILLQPGSKGPIPMKPGSTYAETGLIEVKIDAHIDMMTAGGSMQPGWMASQADLLANDWGVVE